MLVEDRLFATLDATTRRLDLPGGEAVLLTDTVGFVRKLPHQLVEAFKSTLEVVAEADLLVHVVDASAADPEGNIDAVRTRARARSAPTTCPSCSRSTRPTSRPSEAARLAEVPPGLGGRVGAVTGEGVDDLLRTRRRPAAGPRPTWSSCSSPTTAATCWPPCTARARCSSSRPTTTRMRLRVRLDDAVRSAEFARRTCRARLT